MASGTSLPFLRPGDIIYRYIRGNERYRHYGVYVGEGYVIHFLPQNKFLEEKIHFFAERFEVSKMR